MPAGPDITPPMKWRRIVNVSDNFIPNCDLKKNKLSTFRKKTLAQQSLVMVVTSLVVVATSLMMVMPSLNGNLKMRPSTDQLFGVGARDACKRKRISIYGPVQTHRKKKKKLVALKI